MLSVKKKLFVLTVVFSLAGWVTATNADSFATYVWDRVKPAICGVYGSFAMVAGALAALMIVIGGIKWIGSGDDPGARKNAKDMIIHAIVGLCIVVVSWMVVELIISGPGC